MGGRALNRSLSPSFSNSLMRMLVDSLTITADTKEINTYSTLITSAIGQALHWAGNTPACKISVAGGVPLTLVLGRLCAIVGRQIGSRGG